MTVAFQNPVISDAEGHDHGDPFVLKYLETYYLYHTGGRGVHLYTSSNLVNWQYQGIALAASESPDHWAQTDLWAPEVFYHQGAFYMYVAATRLNANGRGDDMIRRQGIARSNSPIGPFTWDERPLVDEWSIDGHPFQDANGSLWLYYNIRTDATRYHDGTTGCGNVVQRLSEPDWLTGEQIPVTFPSERWEGNSEGSWYWNEGPYVLKRRNTYYQMYSGGWFADGTYAVGFATAPSHQGPWTKYPANPVLRSTETILGPGHHCITLSPDGVTPYAVYHAHIPGLRGRKVHMDRFYWAGDRPVLVGPTSGEQPYPPQAAFQPNIPHWHLSAWVKGDKATVAGHTISLSSPAYQLVQATKRGNLLEVRVDGVERDSYRVGDVRPDVSAEGDVRGLAVTSHLDDGAIYTLAPSGTQSWSWGGSCTTEVALAVKGTAAIHAHGRREVRHHVASVDQYELIRFSMDEGLDRLDVVAGDEGAQVTDVLITAR